MAKKKKLKKKKLAPKSKKLKKVKKKVVAKKKVKKRKKKNPARKKNVKQKKIKKEKVKKKKSKKETKVKAPPAKEILEEKPKEKPPPVVNEVALAKAKAKALAKARLKLKEKERQNIPAQATDQKAFDKQLKLAEPKYKLILEYIIHASMPLLYDFITSPSGMSEWFSDDVNINGSVYSFLWEGSKQDARVLSLKENKFIRFQWTDRAPNSYFEFRIEKNELTEELSLIITDFAETEDEKNSLEILWQGQVQRLMKVIGSKV
ncbi:MAG: hypothetical protein HY841_07010 [Bacteroidetes bacterium]|nr:hypothetical protein [Bacteroidota bacterium]